MITNNPDKRTSVPEFLRRLEEQGADVVGLNCSYGPASILKAVKDAKAVCKVGFFYKQKFLQERNENPLNKSEIKTIYQ